ncbi:hypothetical protein HAX54_015374 [Datura stramonium]|uniref:Uncharacterized protein n=1 Tax=Datura stramonium TaxID=4076 RepID=A0ABS8RZC0_DATST|nr:hypothetical protein [Datura stramonium]
MGSTSANVMEEWERKSKMRDRQIAAIMKLLEMLTRKEMDTKTRSVNAIGMVDQVEQFENEVYFLNHEKEYVLANQSMGSHLHHQEEIQGSLGQGQGNEVESYAISIKQLEEGMSHLASQMEPRVRVDMERPLGGTITSRPEGVRCCGDNITQGCKTLETREERVDEENMEKCCAHRCSVLLGRSSTKFKFHPRPSVCSFIVTVLDLRPVDFMHTTR